MSFRARLLALTLVALCLTPAAAAGAAATPGKGTAFHLQVCPGGGIVPGPKRGVLVSLCGKKEFPSGSAIANLMPSGRIVRYSLPRSQAGPLAAGPHGEIWAVRTLSTKTFPTNVYRIDPDGTTESFSLDPVKESSESSTQFMIRDLVVDGNGTAWVATADLEAFAYVYNSYGGDLVRVAPGEPVEAFPLPQGEPENLAVGSDGNVWFTAISGRRSSEHSSEPGTGFIGRVTGAGAFTLFQTPIAHGEPASIAAAPDGRLWFGQSAANRIGTVGLDGTFGREYKVRFGYLGNFETFARQGGLVFDQRGTAWIAGAMSVGRLSAKGFRTRLSNSKGVRSIAVGREGDVWLQRGHEIRRLATA